MELRTFRSISSSCTTVNTKAPLSRFISKELKSAESLPGTRPQQPLTRTWPSPVQSCSYRKIWKSCRKSRPRRLSITRKRLTRWTPRITTCRLSMRMPSKRPLLLKRKLRRTRIRRRRPSLPWQSSRRQSRRSSKIWTATASPSVTRIRKLLRSSLNWRRSRKPCKFLYQGLITLS